MWNTEPRRWRGKLVSCSETSHVFLFCCRKIIVQSRLTFWSLLIQYFTLPYASLLVMDSTPITMFWMEEWTGPPLAVRREQHCLLFIFKALSDKFLPYLSSPEVPDNLTIWLDRPRSFQFFYCPPQCNRPQDSLQLKKLTSMAMLRALWDCAFHRKCTCVRMFLSWSFYRVLICYNFN